MEQEPRVIRGRTELIVSHKDTGLSFIHPPEGPNTYQNVGEYIINKHLELPTGDQIASLVYAAFNSQEQEFRNIQDLMKNQWLWVFNRNLWTPEGVYVVQYPKGTNQPLNQSDLENRLNGKEINRVRFSEDETIRFAPKESYHLENHTSQSLAEDGFIIASFGKEGAEKLSKVSEKFREEPYVWGTQTDSPYQTVSALGSSWGGHRLLVVGDLHGDNRNGCAFGVQKTGEARQI